MDLTSSKLGSREKEKNEVVVEVLSLLDGIDFQLENAKKQVEINEKDIKDILSILLDHDMGIEAPNQIDVNYLTGLTSSDWGLYTTLSDNLNKIKELLADYLIEDEVELVKQRIGQLLLNMVASPKSLRWKVRAKVGRRVEWYELPDEVKR